MIRTPDQPTRRKLLTLLCGLPLWTACQTDPRHAARRAEYEALDAEGKAFHDRMKKKYRGIYGMVLRLDALTPKKGVMIMTDTGRRFTGAGNLGPRAVGNLTYTDSYGPPPRALRVTWREGDYTYKGQGVWEGGTVAGDYTVPLAERIPEELLDYLRSGDRKPYWVGKSVRDGTDIFATPIGRALRLKIRLADNGVLIGWDVEERFQTRFGTGLMYKMAGGDFREVQLEDGVVVEKGWYIDPQTGQKIETDH
jgi:integrase